MVQAGRILALVGLLAVWCILFPTSTSAASHQCTETFNSRQYCDTLNTSAWWDTLAGELGLHPFELSFAGSCSTVAFAHAPMAVRRRCH
jgi:hypothetical protein